MTLVDVFRLRIIKFEVTVRRFLILTTWATCWLGVHMDAFGQSANVVRRNPGDSEMVEPASILEASGRYGAFVPRRGGSRFSDNSTVYGSAGNIIGVDRSNSSRFGAAASSPFQSKYNFELWALRNELKRARAESDTEPPNGSSVPRLVTAVPPQRLPYPSPRLPRYGKTKEELRALANDAPVRGLTPETKLGATESARNVDPSQLLWMRGRAPSSTDGLSADWFRSQGAIAPYDPTVDDNLETWNGYGGNALGGSFGLPISGGALTFPNFRTEEENRRAFEERLEELLLRSPEVNPLSPIQVTFGNGTATVRGVVPTPSARSAAGSILLADPRVAKVNNLLTFLRPDDETSSLGRLPTVTESNSASAPPMQ